MRTTPAETGLVERPLPGNGHGGCGRRLGETHRWKHRQGAPGRPHAYPGMLLALAGTAVLVMRVVTSIRSARARLRYESWHLLHLYAYLGVGPRPPAPAPDRPGVPRLTGSHAVFWWTAVGTAAGGVLVWRIGLPLYRTLRHGLRVTSVVPERATASSSVYITGRTAAPPVRGAAGQFLNWRFLDRAGLDAAPTPTRSPRPRTAAACGSPSRCLGDGSALDRHLRPAIRAIGEGPFGRLSRRPRTRPPVAFIGAGVGVALLRALAEGDAVRAGRAVLVLRASPGGPLFTRQFAPRPGSAVCSRCACPDAGEAPTPGSAGSAPVDDLTRPAPLGPGHRRARRLPLRPAPWTVAVRRTLARRGPAGRRSSTSRASDGDRDEAHRDLGAPAPVTAVDADVRLPHLHGRACDAATRVSPPRRTPRGHRVIRLGLPRQAAELQLGRRTGTRVTTVTGSVALDPLGSRPGARSPSPTARSPDVDVPQHPTGNARTARSTPPPCRSW